MLVACGLILLVGFGLQALVTRHGGRTSISDIPHLVLSRDLTPGHWPYVDRVLEYPVLAGVLAGIAVAIRPGPFGVLTVVATLAAAVALGCHVVAAPSVRRARVAMGDRYAGVAVRVPELGRVRDRCAGRRPPRVRAWTRPHRGRRVRRRHRGEALPARRRPSAGRDPLGARGSSRRAPIAPDVVGDRRRGQRTVRDPLPLRIGGGPSRSSRRVKPPGGARGSTCCGSRRSRCTGPTVRTSRTRWPRSRSSADSRGWSCERCASTSTRSPPPGPRSRSASSPTRSTRRPTTCGWSRSS